MSDETKFGECQCCNAVTDLKFYKRGPGELEGVERTDWRELEDAGRCFRFADRFGNLFHRRAQHAADERTHAGVP